MVVNRRILNNFKEYQEKNSDFPILLLKLLDEFLVTADRNDLDKEEREKLYDQILDKYVDDDKILEWSKPNNG